MNFVNISTDGVVLIVNGQKQLIDNRNLERSLPGILKNSFENEQDNDLFVLNGPGSFTALRVGTLSLNLMNYITKNKFNYFGVSKIDFYKKFVDLGLLPKYGVIFIGQRKKIWLYDFEQMSFELTPIEDLASIDKDYFIDYVFSDSFKEKFNQKLIVDIDMKEGSFEISFKDNKTQLKIEEIVEKGVKQIEPNYMIGPNIS